MKIFRCIVKTFTNLIFIAMILLFAGGIWMNISDIEYRVVLSGSMEPDIMTGSICFIDMSVPYEDIQEGDIIVFSQGNAYVTHRVISVKEEGFVTKGDANTCSDGLSTTKENYYGQNIYSIPHLGYFLMELKSRRGLIIWITCCIALIISNKLCDMWVRNQQQLIEQEKI